MGFPVTCGVSINHLTLNEIDIGPYSQVRMASSKAALEPSGARCGWSKHFPIAAKRYCAFNPTYCRLGLAAGFAAG
jgi:hypothetical protein